MTITERRKLVITRKLANVPYCLIHELCAHFGLVWQLLGLSTSNFSTMHHCAFAGTCLFLKYN